jgi:hypothetical protein
MQLRRSLLYRRCPPQQISGYGPVASKTYQQHQCYCSYGCNSTELTTKAQTVVAVPTLYKLIHTLSTKQTQPMQRAKQCSTHYTCNSTPPPSTQLSLKESQSHKHNTSTHTDTDTHTLCLLAAWVGQIRKQQIEGLSLVHMVQVSTSAR